MFYSALSIFLCNIIASKVQTKVLRDRCLQSLLPTAILVAQHTEREQMFRIRVLNKKEKVILCIRTRIRNNFQTEIKKILVRRKDFDE